MIQLAFWRVGGFGRYLWHVVRRHRASRVTPDGCRCGGYHPAYACNTCDKDWR